MRFDYFFWNNFKKLGYAQGKVMKPFYKNLIQSGDAKEAKLLIEEGTHIVLKNQIIQSEQSIEDINKTIDSIKENLSSLASKKSVQKNMLTVKYEIEKDKINAEYATFLETDIETIHKANKITESFYDDMSNYIQEAKDKIKSTIDNIFQLIHKTQHENNGIIEKEARQLLNDNIESYINISSKERTSDFKDRVYLAFLVFVCFLDTILGYLFWYQILSGSRIWNRLVPLLAFALAIITLAALVGFTHFIASNLKKDISLMNKNISIFMLIFIFFLLIIYIMDSRPGLSIVELYSSYNKNRGETIMRSLLIPGIFVGELLIEKINWQTIGLYQKKLTKPFRYIKSLVAKQLYLIKKHDVSDALREQKNMITEVGNEIHEKIDKELSFVNTLNSVYEIKGMLSPIYEGHEEKINSLNMKLKELEALRQQEINDIDQEYDSIISKEEQKLPVLEHQVRVIKQQLGEAQNSVVEGINMGLYS